MIFKVCINNISHILFIHKDMKYPNIIAETTGYHLSNSIIRFDTTLPVSIRYPYSIFYPSKSNRFLVVEELYPFLNRL